MNPATAGFVIFKATLEPTSPFDYMRSEPIDATCLRDATPGDATAVAAIYNVHVRGTTATFEIDDVDAGAMQRRIADVQERGLPWLVAEADGNVVGYAYAGPWKPRAAYARTVETSIYLDATACGRGLGRRLYAALVERLRAH